MFSFRGDVVDNISSDVITNELQAIRLEYTPLEDKECTILNYETACQLENVNIINQRTIPLELELADESLILESKDVIEKIADDTGVEDCKISNQNVDEKELSIPEVSTHISDTKIVDVCLSTDLSSCGINSSLTCTSENLNKNQNTYSSTVNVAKDKGICSEVQEKNQEESPHPDHNTEPSSKPAENILKSDSSCSVSLENQLNKKEPVLIILRKPVSCTFFFFSTLSE